MKSPPELQYDFRFSILQGARIGPRREVTLEFELWPEWEKGRAWQPGTGEGQVVEVRFGGVENLDAVRTFFHRLFNDRNSLLPPRERQHYQLEESGAEFLPLLLELHDLHYDPSRCSRPGRLFYEIEFDRVYERLTIQCRNITLTERPNGNS